MSFEWVSVIVVLTIVGFVWPSGVRGTTHAVCAATDETGPANAVARQRAMHNTSTLRILRYYSALMLGTRRREEGARRPLLHRV